MAEETETLGGRIALAIEELHEHIEYEDFTSKEEKERFLDEPHDVIHEIADGCVPVYNADLLAIAAQSPAVALDEPDIGPAFDGAPTPINIIAANIYEALVAALFEEAQRLKDELDDEEQNEDEDEA